MKNISLLSNIISFRLNGHWRAEVLTNIGIVATAAYTKEFAVLKLNAWIENENSI